MEGALYTLTLGRMFKASHYLIGGDWGTENELHPHNYRLELELAGGELNEHGFLVDLEELEALLDETLVTYDGQTLNDDPAFAGLNPSLEHFSRILSHSLDKSLNSQRVRAITVRLWEDDKAWASFHLIRE